MKVWVSGERDNFCGILNTRPCPILNLLRNRKSDEGLVSRHPTKNEASAFSVQNWMKMGRDQLQRTVYSWEIDFRSTSMEDRDSDLGKMYRALGFENPATRMHPTSVLMENPR